MVTLPAETAVARPEALIVATLVLDDVHVTEDVKFSDVPSLKTPVAVNC